MNADWDQLAAENYGAALDLRVPQRFRSAVSRAYYAAYSSAVAALKAVGIMMPVQGNPSHRSMPGLIQNHLTQLSLVRRSNLAGTFGRLYRLRIMADYQPQFIVSDIEARQAIGLMLQVIRDCKEARA